MISVMIHQQRIADQLNVRPQQVAATVALLDDGNTLPFIARYRKEATGSLDEEPVSYTHLRAHETVLDLVCRLLLEKKKKTITMTTTSHSN